MQRKQAANQCQMAGVIARPKKKKKINREALRKDVVFNCVLAALKRWCPPAKPVKLVINKMANGLLGSCRFDGGKFVIRLNSAMGPPQAVDVLVHEWAHALSWNYTHDKLITGPSNQELVDWGTHDATWGCAYSRTYCAYLDGAAVAATLNKYKTQEEQLHAARDIIARGHRKRGWM